MRGGEGVPELLIGPTFRELSLHNSHGKIGVRVIIKRPGCRNLKMGHAVYLQPISPSIQALPLWGRAGAGTIGSHWFRLGSFKRPTSEVSCVIQTDTGDS